MDGSIFEVRLGGQGTWQNQVLIVSVCGIELPHHQKAVGSNRLFISQPVPCSTSNRLFQKMQHFLNCLAVQLGLKCFKMMEFAKNTGYHLKSSPLIRIKSDT